MRVVVIRQVGQSKVHALASLVYEATGLALSTTNLRIDKEAQRYRQPARQNLHRRDRAESSTVAGYDLPHATPVALCLAALPGPGVEVGDLERRIGRLWAHGNRFVPAADVLAGADPDHLRILRVDGDTADRVGGLIVEHRRPA